MIVTVRSLTQEQLSDNDYRDALEIDVDGKVMMFFDGEPEDATIARDFNDVRRIPGMLRLAFEAGASGGEFKVVKERMGW